MKVLRIENHLIAFSVLLIGASAFGQQLMPIQTKLTASEAEEAEASRAKISFSETMWDFGYVPKTGKVVHTYQIKNVGEDTLVIAKVRTTCGCTNAPLSKQELAPNETAELSVIFDPNKVKVGQTTKRVQVISNDPNNPFAEVAFTAKIGTSSSLVKITPASIDFDSVSPGSQQVKTLIIENVSGERLSMKKVEGPGSNFSLDLEDGILEPGESVQAALALKDDLTSGILQTSLTLAFECSKAARISIPIGAFVVEE